MTEKDIDTLNSEAKALFDKLDFPQVAKLSNKAYTLAKKHKYPKGIAEALLTRGILFWVQNENLQARELFIQAQKIILSIDDKDLLNLVYSRLGMTYGQLLLSEECIDYLTKALEVSKSLKDEYIISVDYINLAIALVKIKNFPQAIEYFNKAMTYAKKVKNEPTQAVILTNLSKLYINTGDYESALQHGLDALKLAEKSNNIRNILTIYHNISSSHMYLKRYEDAEKYTNLCLTLASKNNVMPLVTLTELLLAEIKLLQRKYDEAKEILVRVEKSPTFKSDVEVIYKYFNIFLKVCEATGDYKNAYEKHIELMEFDRKQAEINLTTKLETQELRQTLSKKR